VKKQLSQRLHIFGDGRTAPSQRDLYSAFLARHCEEDRLAICRVRENWPPAEPLLRRAMSRPHQSVSEAGAACFYVGNGVGVDRASKNHTLCRGAAHA
jgi:putative transposase